MSVLAGTTKRALARAGAFPCSTPHLTVLAESRRYASRKRALARDAKKTAGVQRDSTGKPIQARREKTPPLFTPLPVAQLGAPVFETDSRPAVKLAPFSTTTVTRENVGQAMEFSSTNDTRAHFGLPKEVWKDFKLLGEPCSVIRDATIDTVEILSGASESGLSSKDTRLVFSGASGCGKSYLLLQAVEWALANNWVVMYIPRAVNLVNSTTPYTYDPRTQTFLQPEATHQILHRTREANKKILRSLKIKSPLISDGARPIPAGTSLYDMMDIPREEVSRAPLILNWFMSELEGQSTHPVLLAIDDFQALFNRSSYRDPHFKPIAPYHLSLPRLFLSYISGRCSFTKGAIIGSLDSSDPLFPITPELRETLNIGMYGGNDMGKPTVPWPYVKRSRFLSEYADGLRNVRVPSKLSVSEAGGVFEVWMKHKVLGSRAYEELFMAKYVESAGNARDFVWKGLLRTLQT